MAVPESGYVQQDARGRWLIDPVSRFAGWLIESMILAGLIRCLEAEARQGFSRLLDLGAGNRPYLPVYSPYVAESLALDWPGTLHAGQHLNVWGSADALPFADESFDAILCTEVLEHVREPAKVLLECQRTLRPGGWLLVTTPFFNPLHELPWDYYRYTPFALQAMGDTAGLTLESLNEKGGLGAFLVMLWVYLITVAGVRLPRYARRLFFSRWNPLFWALLVWPQQLYFLWWNRVEAPDHGPALASEWPSLQGVTLGYVALYRKPMILNVA